MLSAVIIDDEPLVRDDLTRMLSSHPEIKLIGEAGTVPQAEKLLSEVRPDLVFLDIQLIGGSGFDLIPSIHPDSHIIFFTAHDDFAVRAFEINALDYLLKPITAERLAESIGRVGAGSVSTPSPASGEELQMDDRILIRAEREQRMVPFREVNAVVSIGGNYTLVHLNGNETMTVRRAMGEWESLLPEDIFFRIHRSTIINLNRIEKVLRLENDTCRVYLCCMEIPFDVSRRSAGRLKRLLNGVSFSE